MKNIISLIVTILVIGFSTTILARDHNVDITPESGGACGTTVKVLSGSDCNKNQCGNDAACLCIKKGEFITWNLTSDKKRKFKFKFSDGSPLAKNCGKNFKKGSNKCKVKESVSPGDSFNYDVIMEGCGTGTDPRIVIR